MFDFIVQSLLDRYLFARRMVLGSISLTSCVLRFAFSMDFASLAEFLLYALQQMGNESVMSLDLHFMFYANRVYKRRNNRLVQQGARRKPPFLPPTSQQNPRMETFFWFRFRLQLF